MKYNFIERKLQVDGEVIAYAEKKVGKLDKFFKKESEATITFSTERESRPWSTVSFIRIASLNVLKKFLLAP